MEEGGLMAHLFESMMVPCVMIEKKRVPDGQGGTATQWTDGAEFMAAVIKNDTLAAIVAEKQGVTEVYKVTTKPGVGLEFHEVFRRKFDGATFRVTSNATDSQTPKMASFAFEQVTAERWTLT
jgi:hypothetical protein